MALKSKTLLFKALDEFFKTTDFTRLGLSAARLSNETYGKNSMVYVTSTDTPQRMALESFLTAQGFKVHKGYNKGGRHSEVQVSYFKGWHHDV